MAMDPRSRDSHMKVEFDHERRVLVFRGCVTLDDLECADVRPRDFYGDDRSITGMNPQEVAHWLDLLRKVFIRSDRYDPRRRDIGDRHPPLRGRPDMKFMAEFIEQHMPMSGIIKEPVVMGVDLAKEEPKKEEKKKIKWHHVENTDIVKVD